MKTLRGDNIIFHTGQRKGQITDVGLINIGEGYSVIANIRASTYLYIR